MAITAPAPRPRGTRPRGTRPARHLSLAPAPAAMISRRRPGRLRLTRRGRLVVRSGGLLLLALGVLAALLLASHPASAGTAQESTPLRYHVVLPGETLWSIAAGLVPGEDPRDAIVAIEQFNRLPGATVVVGQRLALPSSK